MNLLDHIWPWSRFKALKADLDKMTQLFYKASDLADALTKQIKAIEHASKGDFNAFDKSDGFVNTVQHIPALSALIAMRAELDAYRLQCKCEPKPYIYRNKIPVSKVGGYRPGPPKVCIMCQTELKPEEAHSTVCKKCFTGGNNHLHTRPSGLSS